MRRISYLLLLTLFTLGSIGCSGGGAGGGGSLSETEVIEAWATTYVVSLLATIMIGSDPAITAHPSGNGVVLTNYDISSGSYTSISGTYTFDATPTHFFNFTLTGGPVNTISYTLSDADFNATGTVTIDVIANGATYPITIEPDNP